MDRRSGDGRPGRTAGAVLRDWAGIYRAVSAPLRYRRKPLLMQAMREDWNRRGAEAAMALINSARRDWSESEFFTSGQADVAGSTEAFFQRMHFHPFDKRMLEIGCGIGRMTRTFAARFQEVYALDVSEVMIEQARARHRDRENIRWSVGNGVDLAQYPRSFFDFCYSYIVFQHIPSEWAVLNYVREIGRVLKPGGLCKFQVQNGIRVRRFAVVDSPRVPCLKKRIVLTSQQHDTWSGAFVSERKLRRVLAGSHVQILELTGQGTQYMWVEGQKL